MSLRLLALNAALPVGATLLLLAGFALAPAPTTGDDGLPEPEVTVPAVRDPALTPLRKGQLGGEETAVPFPLSVDGAPVTLRVTPVFVMPGEEVRIEAAGVPGRVLVYREGTVRPAGEDGWLWRAPGTPGNYALKVEADAGVVHLTALVVHPAAHVQGGRLGDYAIGDYMQTPLRGDPAYLPPDGFVEASSADADLLVTPRLTLGQFVCKQPGEPRFLALSAPLLLKLEAILDEVEATGRDPGSLVVMSGFRTPAYNRAIGNNTVYSRHLWGDAADIYLDGDGDGVMDDLDGNGRSDEGDAQVLAQLVERVMTRRKGLHPGGLATYRANAVHGPFVHVDARGHRARW